jgi:hypothetical protein
VLGIRRDEVLGRSHWEVFALTLGTDLEQEYRQAAAGEARELENHYTPRDRWFYTAASRIPLAGWLSISMTSPSASAAKAIYGARTRCWKTRTRNGRS